MANVDSQLEKRRSIDRLDAYTSAVFARHVGTLIYA